MEIEVGEYIRTTSGEIGKLTKITEEPEVDIGIAIMPEVTAYWLNQYTYVEETDIIKHSKNIIDIIEVGDFVNGSLVISDTKNTRTETCDGEEHKCIIVSRSKDDVLGWKTIDFDIKNILTKEQYEQNSFKL